MLTLVLEATIRCPHCGFEKLESMPSNACVHFYECTKCRTLLRPLEGSCCVFCSYASVQCPPKQEEARIENLHARRTHWEQIYRSCLPTDLSWYQVAPSTSLDLIRSARIGPAEPIIDVGGGASTLADHLLRIGFRDVTVLDVSTAALAHLRGRLGPRAESVTSLEEDLLEFVPRRRYRLWHDRAAFHFLTHPDDQRRYAEVLRDALLPDGHAIIATFGPGGPPRCSGLEVIRYSPSQLGAALGSGLILEETAEERHRTPAGSIQEFCYCRFRVA